MKENPILKSLRFVLKPIEDNTYSNAHLIEMMQDERVQRYIRGHALNDEEVVIGLARFHHINNTKGLGFWLIYDDRQNCVGMCLLKPMPTEQPTNFIETGYWIKPEYWGEGIAAEAAKRMVEYAFADLNLKRVTAVVDPENIGSIKSLEKAGLTRSGTIVAYGTELPFYSIVNECAT